ncbi:DUF2167 domain-containing protein [Pseudoduganella plicata]|uniref:DUF2167 domain-containing protein n=1 Tax=Pseudoduganella plicata TaxID=321984 RepID=A0A4P7BIQ9_9BURK|nr:DUF2167 domain-containing protein [Pseudoduganella plicata]QBQ38112.1 DUF2167 domain-containing protein [Pseudoduganella plicata]GGZ02864.1 hypothetical protein GCM10007388_40610 [Pseudoduganella plicata]
MTFKSLLSAVLCLLLAVPLTHAAEASPGQLMTSLKFQEGKITLPGDIATLNLPPNFRYLSPADAGRLLSEGWGNPPGIETLGMIVPTAVHPLSREGWGVVVTYEKQGHVKDDDADSIKYDELLKTMQESMVEANEERKKQGYQPMTLVGWAEAPHYDKTSHKLYWAKELHSEGDTQNGLNYNIRVLGREGVLVLNAVAGMDQIGQIRNEMKAVTAFSDFTAGNRYADFNERTDKVAEYGLAALIAGGAAAKLGLFGKLFALLLAFKKVIIVGVGAAVMGIGKLLGRKPKVDLTKS